MNDDTLEALQMANGIASPVADPKNSPRLFGRYEGASAAALALAQNGFSEASAWIRSPGGQAAIKEQLRLLDKVLP